MFYLHTIQFATMSGLDLSVLFDYTTSTYAVYKNQLKDEILYSDSHVLFNLLLSKIVVPDEAFKWIVNRAESNVNIINSILENRVKFDKKYDQIVDILSASEFENLSCKQAYSLLLRNGLRLSLYEKHFFFTLLTNKKSYDWEEEYELKNIFTRYKHVHHFVDELICEAIQYADSHLLKNVVKAAAEQGIKYVFDSNTPSHAKVLSWLKRNIVKGCSGEENKLGWVCGPDSGRWPSTHLKDYIDTLACLYTIMS